MDTLSLINALLDGSFHLSPIVILENIDIDIELRPDAMTNGSQVRLFPDLTRISSNHTAVEGVAENMTNVPLLTERTHRVTSSRRPRNPRE